MVTKYKAAAKIVNSAFFDALVCWNSGTCVGDCSVPAAGADTWMNIVVSKGWGGLLG